MLLGMELELQKFNDFDRYTDIYIKNENIKLKN